MNIIPFLIGIVGAYELIDTFNFNYDNINLQFCDGSTGEFKDAVGDVVEYLDTFPYLPDINNKTEAKTVPICEVDMSLKQFGYTRFSTDSDFREILISSSLAYYPVTQYNVILHEMIHLYGLNHVSNYTEVMGYKVTIDRNNNIKEDKERHTLGDDDMEGLKFLYKREKRDNDKCRMRLIRLIEKCL